MLWHTPLPPALGQIPFYPLFTWARPRGPSAMGSDLLYRTCLWRVRCRRKGVKCGWRRETSWVGRTHCYSGGQQWAQATRARPLFLTELWLPKFLLKYFCLFAHKEIPDPSKYFVTRWSTEPWIQMAYSFVKTFGSGEAYDIIAEEIKGTVFFAGEVHILTPNPILFFICIYLNGISCLKTQIRYV